MKLAITPQAIPRVITPTTNAAYISNLGAIWSAKTIETRIIALAYTAAIIFRTSANDTFTVDTGAIVSAAHTAPV